MAKEDTVTLSKIELDAMMRSVAATAVELAQAGAKNVRDKTFEEAIAEHKGEEKEKPLEKQVLCLSDLTGSSFLARVVQSKAYPQGRVVELCDYKYPAGIGTHQNEGGLVPDGKPILRGDNGQPTTDYKQWRWTEFWQRDLAAFVGKPFHSRYVVEGAIMPEWATPSSEPKELK